MFFKFLCPRRKQICVILLFGGGLREGWDSTNKRVLLHRIKHVTKSYKKKSVELYHHPCFYALNQTIYYRCQATHIFKFSNQRHWLDESTDVYSIDFFLLSFFMWAYLDFVVIYFIFYFIRQVGLVFYARLRFCVGAAHSLIISTESLVS